MTEKHFKCRLLTDVVLSASLATEGNLRTLDYLPGSNFLGIVAAELPYNDSLSKEKAYTIFHSGDVSFGDAHLSSSHSQSYAMPYALLKEKTNKDVTKEEAVWVHHRLKRTDWPVRNSVRLRLEQHRGGYLDAHGTYFDKPYKRFTLKSAYDRVNRRSKDHAMFGFESLKKDQVFLFTIRFADSAKEYINEVCTALTGKRRLGKSKTAQFGQVDIQPINSVAYFEHGPMQEDQLTIYAASNLCLLNEYGQSSFQPLASHFGFEGTIDMAASKIRTYSYSPWNSHRNCNDRQRNVILKGSVMVFRPKQFVSVDELKQQVGAYQSEGLGRILYNPVFLQANDKGIWQYKLTKYEPAKQVVVKNEIQSTLGKFLAYKATKDVRDLSISKSIATTLDLHLSVFEGITSSQWGAIRSKAIQAKDVGTLREVLFGKGGINKEENEGYLMNGVAAERYWNSKDGLRRKRLKQLLDDHKDFGTKYIAKFATEMAKLTQ